MKVLARGLALVCLAVSVCVQAQTWPDRSTRLIVPFPAGGVLDALARTIAEPLAQASGQAVIVENPAGAAGNIGIQMVAKARGDGTTVLFVPQGNITINATLLPDAPFKWERDFRPVTLLAYATNVLVVHPAVPARSVPELIALARAQPGKLAYGSPGVGSSLHLVGELFKREAQIDLLHVPYKGTTPAVQDAVAGQVQLLFGALPTLMPMIKSGKLRVLAVTTARRSELLPDVPTLAEGGIAIDVPSWYGVMVPSATPATLAETMHAAMARVLAQPGSREKLAAQGLQAVVSKPAEFQEQIRRETELWARIIRQAGIKAE